MRPLSGDSWAAVKSKIEDDGEGTTIDFEEDSIHDITHTLHDKDGIVVDANREVRVKLYLGQVGTVNLSHRELRSLIADPRSYSGIHGVVLVHTNLPYDAYSLLSTETDAVPTRTQGSRLSFGHWLTHC